MDWEKDKGHIDMQMLCTNQGHSWARQQFSWYNDFCLNKISEVSINCKNYQISETRKYIWLECRHKILIFLLFTTVTCNCNDNAYCRLQISLSCINRNDLHPLIISQVPTKSSSITSYMCVNSFRTLLCLRVFYWPIGKEMGMI